MADAKTGSADSDTQTQPDELAQPEKESFFDYFRFSVWAFLFGWPIFFVALTILFTHFLDLKDPFGYIVWTVTTACVLIGTVVLLVIGDRELKTISEDIRGEAKKTMEKVKYDVLDNVEPSILYYDSATELRNALKRQLSNLISGSERELVEVCLEVLGADAVVNAVNAGVKIHHWPE